MRGVMCGLASWQAGECVAMSAAALGVVHSPDGLYVTVLDLSPSALGLDGAMDGGRGSARRGCNDLEDEILCRCGNRR